MPTCPKCGKEVEAAATVCICGASVEQTPADAAAGMGANGPPDLVPSVGNGPPPRPTLGQRALMGAKGGALMGALYGGAYGLIMWIVMAAMTEMDDKFATLANWVLPWAIMGALAVGVLGALFRMAVPPKAKAPAAPAEKLAGDTKLDKT